MNTLAQRQASSFRSDRALQEGPARWRVIGSCLNGWQALPEDQAADHLRGQLVVLVLALAAALALGAWQLWGMTA